MFSRTLSIPAAEEAIYSEQLVDADPDTLAQLGNWNYQAPAWFVSNGAELELESEDLLDPELSLEEVEPEITAEADVDTAVAAEAMASATEADPASQIPMPGPNDPPLTPEQQRARALLFAEAELAAALDALRRDYEEQLLSFNPAAELTDLRLGSALTKLDRVRGTEILLAGRWLQNVPPRDEPEPIWIQLSTIEDSTIDEPLAAANAAARYREPGRLPSEPFAAPFDDEPAPRPKLEGWLAVTLGRYLHLDLDIAFVDPLQPRVPVPATEDATSTATLNANGTFGATGERPDFALGNPSTATADLRQPIATGAPSNGIGQPANPLPALAPPAAPPESPFADASPAQPSLVRLKQHRRLRSAELHYLDHPRLGVLVRIDPIALDDRTQAALERVKALR